MTSPSKTPFEFWYQSIFGEPMAISHELSSEIATALLISRQRSSDELHELKEMILEIHSTLEGLSEKASEKTPAEHTDPPPLTKAFYSSI